MLYEVNRETPGVLLLLSFAFYCAGSLCFCFRDTTCSAPQIVTATTVYTVYICIHPVSCNLSMERHDVIYQPSISLAPGFIYSGGKSLCELTQFNITLLLL